MTLSGTILKSHYAWLSGHTEDDAQGRLCCKRTKNPLHGRVHHRYRLNTHGLEAPFVTELLLGNETSLGSLVSFVGFWCEACNERPAVPDRIEKADLLFLRDGVPQP
jgi:hypothetical protein